MNIFIIRHGETDWNFLGYLQGISDIPLNHNGIMLAEKTAEGLKKCQIYFDVVYSSPLQRAYETARIISGGRSIIIDDRLKEISFGDYEGKFCRDPSKCTPMPPPGGESIEALQSRTMSFMNDIAYRYKGQDTTLLISTHGTAMRSIVAGIQQRPLSSFWDGCSYDNCGIVILEEKLGSLSVERENVIFY